MPLPRLYRSAISCMDSQTFIYIADALGVLRCTSYISTLNLTDIRSIICLISLGLGPSAACEQNSSNPLFPLALSTYFRLASP